MLFVGILADPFNLVCVEARAAALLEELGTAG